MTKPISNDSFFTKSPFTVEYQGVKHPISKHDRQVTIALSVLSLIFAPFVFFALAKHYRQRKFIELSNLTPGTSPQKANVVSQGRFPAPTSAPTSASAPTSSAPAQANPAAAPQKWAQTLDDLKGYEGPLSAKVKPGSALETEILGEPAWETPEKPGSALETENLGEPAWKPTDAVSRLAATSKFLAFYKSGLTGFLGNFHPCQIVYDGIEYQCSEAAFQHAKYKHLANQNPALAKDPLMNDFAKANGEQAFQLNKKLRTNHSGLNLNEWDNKLRDQEMWKILNIKFAEGTKMREKLMQTGKTFLLEHNEASRDNYWSDNKDGTGKNMLGRMLMAIRDGKAMPDSKDTSLQQTVKDYAAISRSKDFGIFKPI